MLYPDQAFDSCLALQLRMQSPFAMEAAKPSEILASQEHVVMEETQPVAPEQPNKPAKDSKSWLNFCSGFVLMLPAGPIALSVATSP